jgi:hypothetical protein
MVSVHLTRGEHYQPVWIDRQYDEKTAPVNAVEQDQAQARSATLSVKGTIPVGPVVQPEFMNIERQSTGETKPTTVTWEEFKAVHDALMDAIKTSRDLEDRLEQNGYSREGTTELHLEFQRAQRQAIQLFALAKTMGHQWNEQRQARTGANR